MYSRWMENLATSRNIQTEDTKETMQSGNKNGEIFQRTYRDWVLRIYTWFYQMQNQLSSNGRQSESQKQWRCVTYISSSITPVE